MLTHHHHRSRFRADIKFARDALADLTLDSKTTAVMVSLPQGDGGLAYIISRERNGIPLPMALAVTMEPDGTVDMSIVTAAGLEHVRMLLVGGYVESLLPLIGRAVGVLITESRNAT